MENKRENQRGIKAIGLVALLSLLGLAGCGTTRIEPQVGLAPGVYYNVKEDRIEAKRYIFATDRPLFYDFHPKSDSFSRFR